MCSEVVHMGKIGNLPKPLSMTAWLKTLEKGLATLLVSAVTHCDLWLSIAIVRKQGLLGHRGDTSV